MQLLPSSPLTTGDLAEYAARHLAHYKRPSQILLVSSMPLTTTGKVVKVELAKMASQQRPSAATTEEVVR